MRRQKGGSQAVSHINNSLGRSQIGLKANGEGRGGDNTRPPYKRSGLGFPVSALPNLYVHKHTSSFLT